MITFFITAGIGLLLCILGIINMTGNISSLHWYHRQRVTEENRKPFGRLVGLGTLIIGIAIITFGLLLFLHEKTQLDWIAILGTAALLSGIVSGMIISFYAMIKYNKGIF
ncbi:MAG: hypothetical protein E7668_04245 [Ruminococcaceae bacterium]|nr:hypothetical protein [Oscillospiraceae bacterium]